MGKTIASFEELNVYQKAFRLQQAIFEHSKAFPAEERFSLTDQVRRASHSVGAGIAESWAKRRYKAHFISKLSDADSELGETRHWLHTAKACQYLSAEEHDQLLTDLSQVGAMLGKMLNEPDPWLLKPLD